MKEPTGKNGRFTINKLPNVPLTIMAYFRPPADSPDNAIRFAAKVDVAPGERDIEIILDPKLVRGKK